MDLNLEDVLLLVLHPMLAVVVVYPLIGVVVRLAWQTRQRRLGTGDGKSKIPPGVGPDHLQLGRWLTGSVTGIALLGTVHPIFSNILKQQLWEKEPFKVVLILLMYGVTIGALAMLYRARQRLWRGVFATLSGMGLVVVGFQDGVYRRDSEWFISHFYIGITAALLMIFALAIAPDIYQDRTNRWRKVHVALNCIALVLFLGQGFTGTRDLLEIPLSWQKSQVYQCNFDKTSPQYKTCPASVGK
jgi:hypothetical protein